MNKELVKRYGEPYINEDLLKEVMKARENTLLHEDSWKIWEKDLNINEQRYLSELCREFKKFSQEELAVATIIAVENFPEMVFQILMEKYLSIINEKEKENGRN